ncbi:YhcG family protein [Microbacterium sp. NPDC089698]|uniref:PDDEXK nuclease domain-containing protein n=1 Tax=Microbacterium sp. NPDC089698 TaxID=3364200 RepID=UPI00380237FB
MSDLVPDDYAEVLADLKNQVHAARYRVQRAANTELLRLWWRVGRTILDRQQRAPWGSGVLRRLADDLRAEFPAMKGFSLANLKSMRRFAETWPDEDAIGQQAVGQLPWGHVVTLMERLDDQELRNWYAGKAAFHGWSRAILTHQIRTRLHEREAAAVTNFRGALERSDSELAQQLTKDPYALDFLAIDSDASERALEDRLVERIIETLRELGPGFSFVGRQVQLTVGESEFFVDLLFFHVEQLRYVVIELKTTPFTPADTGQLSFYVKVVDEQLRIPSKHEPTVGILLVADKDDAVVRYALASTAQPVAVSRYELGEDEQKALPDEATIARAFADELARGAGDVGE